MSPSLQVELDPGCPGALGRAGEHRRRDVDPDHAPPRALGDRHGDAAVPDRELDDRPVGLGCERDVELDVLVAIGRVQSS